MKEKKNLIIILILLVGVVGITIAYFSNTTSIDNLFSTKKYGSTITEEFISPDSWLPGDETDKSIIATNTGEVDQAVRISYTEKWLDSNNNELNGWIHEDGSKSSHETEEELSSDERVAIINFDNNDDWTYKDGYYYYNYKLSPNESTSSLIKSVTFNPKTKLDDTCITTISDGKKTITCNSSGSDYDNARYTLTFKIETVQFNKYMNAWNTDVAILEEQVLFCDAFEVGEVVTYNNADYYVLKDSSTSDDYVTLLKKDPLTASEVNQYSDSYVSQDGEYSYYESDTCNENNQTGCSTNYDTSDVKKIIDGWSSSFSDDLVSVDGYKTRLLVMDEVVDNFYYDFYDVGTSDDNYYRFTSSTPTWFYDIESIKDFWTMSSYQDSNVKIYNHYYRYIGYMNSSFNTDRIFEQHAIRPVINLKKNVINNGCVVSNNNNQFLACDFGEEVTFDGEQYYVVDSSDETKKSVTLLKKDFLTVEEVNENNDDYVSVNGEFPFCIDPEGCKIGSGYQTLLSYDASTIKKLLDNWASKYNDNLVNINGMKARLLNENELNNKFNYNNTLSTSNTPEWAYIESVKYWSSYYYSYSTHKFFEGFYSVSDNLHEESLDNGLYVRPVINLKKSAIESGCHIDNDNNIEQQIASCDIDNFNHISYSIGDTISYNNDNYYVIENSDADQNYLTLLKTNPLTYEELNKYNNGYEIQYDNDIGIMSYYKSSMCYNDNYYSTCKTTYSESYIKDIVDNWSYKIDNNLVEINGYKARLITGEELRDNFNYEFKIDTGGYHYFKSEITPSWIYENYNYWTMSPDYYLSNNVLVNIANGNFDSKAVFQNYAIRPVINLKKCAIDNTGE